MKPGFESGVDEALRFVENRLDSGKVSTAENVLRRGYEIGFLE